MTAEALDATTPVLPRRPVVLRHRVRGKVLVLLCVLYAISYVDRVNISTAAPYLQSDLSLSDIRKAAGLGLRLRTPWFMLRLDYGLKLDRRTGESAGRLFFSIGQAF